VLIKKLENLGFEFFEGEEEGGGGYDKSEILKELRPKEDMNVIYSEIFID
jgi:hypothetical protein